MALYKFAYYYYIIIPVVLFSGATIALAGVTLGCLPSLLSQ